MEIESFLKKSEGEWNSMRSGHSLAFKQFEEVISKINIQLLEKNDYKVKSFLEKSEYRHHTPISPFEIKWEGDSNWQEDNDPNLCGSSILIPIAESKSTGIILRSLGYAESIEARSNFSFLSDGTMVLSTIYKQTIAEERIWFLNRNVRCRSSVVRSLNNKAILQTSFASEIRKVIEN